MALLNLCMKFKNFFGQKHSIEALRKWQQEKYSQLVQGSAKSRIYAGKSTKRGFSKKGLTRIKKKFLFQVPLNLQKAWNAKLGAGSFFAIKKPIQEVCVQYLHFRFAFKLCSNNFKSFTKIVNRADKNCTQFQRIKYFEKIEIKN